ncbi:MAG: L-glutamate gamma-semialdehyde dehydrogenase, partial [Pseudomonadota bacterium]
NQIVDENVAPEIVAADPFAAIGAANPAVLAPDALFAPERRNSAGLFLGDPQALSAFLDRIDDARRARKRRAGNISVISPATGAEIGATTFLSGEDAARRMQSLTPWASAAPLRAKVLNAAADRYETAAPELCALLMDEAGKTLIDCIGEVREAVDFLRYYAAQIAQHEDAPLGIVACISPWNFPLAIFTGQIAAALAAGNGVAAKPAETTTLIAERAVELLFEAGVPETALAFIPGEGGVVGPAICRHDTLGGVCFTGSTATGRKINQMIARHRPPGTPLIAETGGINAMIVDSTALPEQAVTDIVASAFQSAGQRCSALRVLYVQDEIADDLLTMLFGAMDALTLGAPQNPATDIGPVIDAHAKGRIDAYLAAARREGRVLKELSAPASGTYVGPAVLSVSGIKDVTEEVFGPVLHVARFKADELDHIIEAINATGYGLTFGLHTRIDGRVQTVIDKVSAGNVYVNRNQIGAVVGSQPFGGHGLSGTGPKAGGPRYLGAFSKAPKEGEIKGEMRLPGPTGETNTYRAFPRSGVLCAGPGRETAAEQAAAARAIGCENVIENGEARADALTEGLSAVIYWGQDAGAWALACADHGGPILPLVTSTRLARWLIAEQTVCVDTTASGGNAELLAASSKMDIAAE